MDVEEIVALSVKHNVSDLHLCSDSPPLWRRTGRLEPAPFPSPDFGALLKAWLNDEQQGICWANGQVDFAATVAGGQRLRGSAFKQMRGVSVTLRLLPRTCPQLASLGAPRVIPELLTNASGLILVTGATGSGKSTTLAAMVDFLNHHTNGHILTLEDPVEFIYQSARCLIQQREIGQHSPSFADALRSALRQDPDVILLGELRDSETIRLALTAAETGHLVRSQLAGSLRAVLAQKLLPDLQGGRVALYELLVNTAAAANLIREGKTWQLPGIIQTGQQAGMQNFDQSLAERRAQGRL